MITINTEKLKELKPCTERFKNWLENYDDVKKYMMRTYDCEN